MAKEKQTEKLALDALAGLLGSAPRPLHGTKAAAGVFSGASAAEKAAAQKCLDNRWLEPTGEFAGKGKTRKEYFRLSPAGVQAVLGRSDPSELLRQLNDNLRAIQDGPGNANGVVQAGFRDLVARIDELKAELQSKLAETVRPLDAVRGISDLRSQIGQLLNSFPPAISRSRSLFVVTSIEHQLLAAV
jgi:hypothetical protein